jgi:multidrug efflux pump subunit AcrA (membrane-fusion protein)
VLKQQIVFIYILLFLFLFSCSDDNKSISTYTVPNKNLENILIIDGFVEPVFSTTLQCPGYVDGTIVQFVEDGTLVEEGEIVCVLEDTRLKNDYDELLINIENEQANLSKTKANLEMEYAMLEAQVQNNEAETKIANLDSLQLIYSPQTQQKIKTLEMEIVAIQKNKLEKKLQALSVIQQSEIKRMEFRIQRLLSRAEAAKEKLDGLKIKAPKKGLAIRAANMFSEKHTKLQIGNPIWDGMPLVIIPEMDKMKIKIKAPEKDFKYINLGDSVFYTFDAMPGNKAWGKILKKAPVGQQIAKGSKVKLFEIESSIDSVPVMPEPGVTANCHILIAQVKDTIVIPQVAIFEEDSMKVVYVKRDNGFEMRQIIAGLSSPKEAIITAGLRRNETIALTKPASVKAKILLPDSIAKRTKKEGKK